MKKPICRAERFPVAWLLILTLGCARLMAGPEDLQPGEWTGTLEVLGERDDVIYVVQQTEAGTAATMFTEGRQLALHEIREEEGRLRFQFSLVVGEQEVVYACELTPDEHGIYRGACVTGEEEPETLKLTMVRPHEEPETELPSDPP